MPEVATKPGLVAKVRTRLQNDRRLSRLVHGSVSGLLSRGLALLVSAVTLPLTVRYLGQEEYGIWVTVSTTVVMLAVLDLGISNTLTNFIAESHAKDDTDTAGQYFASAFWTTCVISALLGVVGIAAWHWIPWASLFSLKDPQLAYEAKTSVAISICFFLISLPLSLGNRALAGYQQVQTSNYFAMCNSLLGLVAIVAGVYFRVSLSMLMFAYCCAMLTGSLALNLWLWTVGKPWLRPGFSKVRRSNARDLFGEGFLFFILQIAGLIVFNSDNLVITHYLGADQVTPYSVAWRLMGYASMLQGLMIPALWPAFSDAYHRGDLPWMRSIYRRIQRGTILGVGSIAGLFCIIGPWIIRVWAAKYAVPSMRVLVAMAVWSVILSVTVNQATLLAATRRIGLQALTSGIAAAVNLAGSIYLVKQMGAFGVILATIVSYLIFVIAPQMWEVRNILSGRYLANQDAS